jgi:hypothetical protein
MSSFPGNFAQADGASVSERHEPALRHAVDELPDRIVARQAERAGWVRAAGRQLSPKRLPATLTAAPGAAHRRNARLLGMVAAGFMALFAVSVLIAGGLDDPAIVLLSMAPPATAGAGALWHLGKARKAPSRMRLTLSETGVALEADGRAWSAPLTAFEGIALRSVVTQKANPRARSRRTAAEVKMRVGEEIRLYWVELTHADPEQSIPLWASDAPFASSDGLGAARGFAERLGLPLLSTAGISSVWDDGPRPPGRKDKRR